MRPAHRAALAATVGVLFAVTYVVGGKVLPGIVGGVLAAILLYVAIGRFQEQHEANRARRERQSR
jgi:uncharacterized protein (DUF2062 family)